jgi:Uma2 family endonuclease
MATLILDPGLEREAHRKVLCNPELEKYLEVWNGVTVMSPLPNDEHQDLQVGFVVALAAIIRATGTGYVRAGVNVAQTHEKWDKNYRAPDVVVYLNTTTAINHDTHWEGGPDFLVEIISPGEDPLAKHEFYAAVKTHEVLNVLRNPWGLELFRLEDGKLQLVGRSEVGNDTVLSAESVGLTFRLVAGAPRPIIRITHPATAQQWNA